MIQLDNVTKRFPGGQEALSGLSLSVDKGEMVFVTGHSGAGKSTLLRLIALIERPSSGEVIVDHLFQYEQMDETGFVLRGTVGLQNHTQATQCVA